jgi:hypothetical protein
MQTSRKQTKGKAVRKKKPRVHRVSFMFNKEEYKAFERHLKKYGIKTKSKWLRSIIMAEIWKKMSEDYPTLFNEEEMR